MQESRPLEDTVADRFYHTFFKEDFIPSFTEKYGRFKEYAREKLGDIASLYHRTAAEIITGVIILAVPTLIYTASQQLAQNHCKRLGFSEVEGKEFTAMLHDTNIPHATEYPDKSTDYYMKVFEANNISWGNGFFREDNTESFANELEYKIDYKIHPQYTLPELHTRLKALSDSLKKDFNYLGQLAQNADLARKLYEKAWKDTHVDQTHTETDTEEVDDYDEDGNVCGSHEVTTKREVYDQTDNSYEYHPQYGLLASQKHDDITGWFPKIVFKENFVLAKETHAENEYAIEKSRRKELKGRRLTPEEYVIISNQSLLGSNLYLSLRAIDETHRNFLQTGILWREHKNTAHSMDTTTYDHSHGEPKEFQTSQKAQEQAKDLIMVINDMMNTVDVLEKNRTTLDSVIHEYVAVVKDHKKGDAKELKSEAMSLAEEGYGILSPKGIELNSANWWTVVLWTSIMGAVGGILGEGLNFLDNRYDLYSRIHFRKRKNITE